MAYFLLASVKCSRRFSISETSRTWILRRVQHDFTGHQPISQRGPLPKSHKKNGKNHHTVTPLSSGKHTKNDGKSPCLSIFHGKTHYFDWAMASIAILASPEGTEVKANGFSSTEFMVPRQSLKVGPMIRAWHGHLTPPYHWIGWENLQAIKMVFPMTYIRGSGKCSLKPIQ